jgi:hypothetical protein
LSDQAEQIKISPEPMNPEEMARLWATFQAHYRPTVAYRVTVVLIETEHARRNVLPVLTLGPGDRGVFTQPNLTSPTPTLTAATPPNEKVSAQLDDDVTLEGHRLDGSTLMDEATGDTADGNITIRFFDPRRQRVLEAEPQASNTPNRMTVRLRDAEEPGGLDTTPEKRWAAGFYLVSALYERGDASERGDTYGRTTNEIPLTLAPEVRKIEVESGTDGKVTFTVECEPEVRPEQRVSLLIWNAEIPAEPRTEQTDTLKFGPRSIPPKTYFYRLRVDGVDSP